jgi:hypothetical protein
LIWAEEEEATLKGDGEGEAAPARIVGWEGRIGEEEEEESWRVRGRKGRGAAKSGADPEVSSSSVSSSSSRLTPSSPCSTPSTRFHRFPCCLAALPSPGSNSVGATDGLPLRRGLLRENSRREGEAGREEEEDDAEEEFLRRFPRTARTAFSRPEGRKGSCSTRAMAAAVVAEGGGASSPA